VSESDARAKKRDPDTDRQKWDSRGGKSRPNRLPLPTETDFDQTYADIATKAGMPETEQRPEFVKFIEFNRRDPWSKDWAVIWQRWCANWRPKTEATLFVAYPYSFRSKEVCPNGGQFLTYTDEFREAGKIICPLSGRALIEFDDFTTYYKGQSKSQEDWLRLWKAGGLTRVA
jgi:hypothetical protein